MNSDYSELMRAMAIIAAALIVLAIVAIYLIGRHRKKVRQNCYYPTVELFLFADKLDIKIENASDKRFEDFIFFSNKFLEKYKGAKHPLTLGSVLIPTDCFVYSTNPQQLKCIISKMVPDDNLHYQMYDRRDIILEAACHTPKLTMLRKNNTLSISELLPKTKVAIHLYFK